MGPSDTLDERKLKLLRRSVIFRDAPAELLARGVAASRVRRLPKGQTLFQQGDEGDALYGVLSGHMRIFIEGRDGRQLSINFMEPGDIFGEIALMDGLPRTASADAVEDCELMSLDREAFEDLLEREPRLARRVIELLCERIRTDTVRLSEYAFLDLRARLAKKLHDLAISHGLETDHGLRLGIKLSQSDLAQTLGVTRETVNKQIQAWTRIGLLRNEQGRITIRDMARLKEQFEADSD